MIPEIVRETLDKRVANVPPAFTLEHKCPDCGVQFLCPDRYIANECGPSRELKRMNSAMNTYLFPCMPCLAKLSQEERNLWNDANAIGARP